MALPSGQPIAEAQGPPREVVVDNISFSYRRKPVFHEFSCVIQPGRTLLLGPNGAGKSTLLQLLVGLLTIRRGTINPGPDASVGYMPQQVRPVPGLSVLEQVTYCAWLKGLSHKDARAEALRAVERVDLAAEAKTASGRLSGGQLRRLGLAQSLVGAQKLLLLDEPTAGLDPDQRDRFAGLISEIDMPVVVATHQVEDISRLFDHVLVLFPEAPAYAATVGDFLKLDESGQGDAVAAYRAVRGLTDARSRGGHA